MELSNPKQRRLFEFLLSSKVRKPTGLAPEFVKSLSKAFEASHDPAQRSTAVSTADTPTAGPWRLQSVKTVGFGGLNAWNGDTFCFDVDGESVILEGANGSGKSSLVAAIIWGLTGERPRDHADSMADEPQPVFSNIDTKIGKWPPIAAYPDSRAEIGSQPRVHVELTFENSSGSRATVARTLESGRISRNWDAEMDVPPILIEAGLLMPSRLARLHLKGDDHRLSVAVQQLTGFDDLVAISGLVEGLCHASREYRSYKKAALKRFKLEFAKALRTASTDLHPVDERIEAFVPADTRDKHGSLARFAKNLKVRAEELERVIIDDLSDKLDPSDSPGNVRVMSAITQARADLQTGLEGLPTWTRLCLISDSFDARAAGLLRKAIDAARKDSEKALKLLDINNADSKYRLKAVGARWHEDHRSGPIENCPLCDQALAGRKSLIEELEKLRAAGDDAARDFHDNLRTILSALDQATPAAVKQVDVAGVGPDPRDKLIQDLRERFVLKGHYANCLNQFGLIVETALSDAPSGSVPADHVPLADVADILKPVAVRIATLERMLVLARWFQVKSQDWKDWWKALAGFGNAQCVDSENDGTGSSDESGRESLSAHLSRLEDALAKAKPFRDAATLMRHAWTAGKKADQIQQEVDRRKDIASNLAELKKLRGLCESLSREAIEGLSGRVKEILGEIHLEGNLHFQSARLERRDGFTVLGEFSPEVRIDATQVANTSWIRAFLWAFLFALRNEAVEQIGSDRFPLLVVDDPQMTFDAHHRAMWSMYVKSLQESPLNVQLFLTTHDEGFLDLIKVDGVRGREALIAAPTPGIKHAQIFEGGKLEREWDEATSAGTAKAGRSYIGGVREFVEGMLKQLLRGQDADIVTLPVGGLRDRVKNAHDAGRAPWNQPAFKKLVKALDRGRSEVQYLEGSHHTTGRNYGMNEARVVEKFWSKTLKPALERAFRTAREHRLLHRGLSALYGGPAVATLPKGYREQVQAIRLEVIGCASALTDGRVADGMVRMDPFDEGGSDAVMLANHSAYRLAAATLEPVARPGEIVLVHNHKDPTPNSLVVAISEDIVLARRFEIADNHTDVVVLTAQSINPRQIESPVIAHRSSFELYKIVGVLYDDASPPPASCNEVVECGGEASLKGFAKRSLGLVEVHGESAVPDALDGQYLIVADPVKPDDESLKLHDGHPVIAVDSDGYHYFKRLRRVAEHSVVLESLDSGGVYPPVVLFPSNGRAPRLKKVWPVVGVLFERGT